MDALLILGGLLLMVAGYIWVIVLAFGTGLLWGYGSLFPPVALAYIGVHWRTARKGVGLAALGCIPLVVGLALLASHDAARLEAILSLRWLKPEARPPAELAIALSGEFNGKPFAPQSGELIGGVLSLRQGHDFYAQRELQIRLPAQPLGALRLDVLPEDGGALPEVELSWLQPDQDLPEARRLLRGYTLHLDLRPKAPNRLEGEFHLSLPSDYRTTLSGHVELYTDRLRYRHGKVDLSYDSDDTLALVLRDYLQRRFASRDVSLVRAPSWRAASHARPLRIEALVAGQAQVLELTLEKNARREWTVRGDAFPALPAEPATVAAAAAPPEPQALPAPGNATLDLELVQVEPQRYSQRLVKATTVRGRIAEGRFTGLDSEGRLVIRREMPGAGRRATCCARRRSPVSNCSNASRRTMVRGFSHKRLKSRKKAPPRGHPPWYAAYVIDGAWSDERGNPKETLGFQTEVKQLLHLMIHSLFEQGNLPPRTDFQRLGRRRQAAFRSPGQSRAARGRRRAEDPRQLRQGSQHRHPGRQRHRHEPRGCGDSPGHHRQVRDRRLPEELVWRPEEGFAPDRPVRRRFLQRLHRRRQGRCLLPSRRPAGQRRCTGRRRARASSTSLPSTSPSAVPASSST